MKNEDIVKDRFNSILKELQALIDSSNLSETVDATYGKASYDSHEIGFKVTLRLKSAPTKDMVALMVVADDKRLDISKTSADGMRLVGFKPNRKLQYVMENADGDMFEAGSSYADKHFGQFSGVAS